jgi:hypothetical protein
MQLNLKVNHPKKYVRAVSGLFINAKAPSGLTSREIDMISLLVEHSKSGVITQKTREVAMEKMEMKRQSFYNMMATLKGKGVLEDGELNRLFTASAIKINYATDS